MSPLSLALLLATGLTAGGGAFVAGHARRLVRWTADGVRTAPPEQLGLGDRVRVLATGVRIPRPRARHTPASCGWSYEELRLPSPHGGQLAGWLIQPETPHPAAPTAILFHGYAAARDQLLPVAAGFRTQGYRTLLVDFRGTGDSSDLPLSGRPVAGTTLSVHESLDVQTAARWAAAELGDPEPVLYGFSLGAASVVRALARHRPPARAAVVEASFGSLGTTIGARFRALGLPPRGLDRLLLLAGSGLLGVNGFDIAPAADAAAVQVPLWVLHGADDPRVSLAEARSIAAAPQGRLMLTRGLGHEPLAGRDPARFAEILGQLGTGRAH